MRASPIIFTLRNNTGLTTNHRHQKHALARNPTFGYLPSHQSPFQSEHRPSHYFLCIYIYTGSISSEPSDYFLPAPEPTVRLRCHALHLVRTILTTLISTGPSETRQSTNIKCDHRLNLDTTNPRALPLSATLRVNGQHRPSSLLPSTVNVSLVFRPSARPSSMHRTPSSHSRAQSDASSLTRTQA